MPPISQPKNFGRGKLPEKRTLSERLTMELRHTNENLEELKARRRRLEDALAAAEVAEKP